jgi:hypothetical protein
MDGEIERKMIINEYLNERIKTCLSELYGLNVYKRYSFHTTKEIKTFNRHLSLSIKAAINVYFSSV